MKPPSGTVTFLFTDIEGSSGLWEKHPVEMGRALARHDLLLRQEIEDGGGIVFKTIGDAFCAAFETANAAVQVAVLAQRMICAEDWPTPVVLKVRMALHTGDAEFRDGDYFGAPLNRVARILAAGHGGQILVSLSTEELVRDAISSDIRLLDLGECKLRGMSRPERVFQISADALPASFPPLRFLEMVPNNLPQTANSFVGREKELQTVAHLLKESRLVTLTGTGGTGKTRLSLQVGALALTSFPDGVWFVELASLTDPRRVLDSIASAMDLREEAGVPLENTVRRTLAARVSLLILDNCEHLQDACAGVVANLLKYCPKLRVLATSRHALAIADEHSYAVPPLATINPYRDLLDARDPVFTISQFESVRLFLDRAAAVNSQFAVTAKNAPAVAQICWRLDGIPLAIELAAARVRVLSAEQIAERLDDRFRLLTGGNRSVLPHQQTLRTLIDWSYDLLSETERVLLRRLGVFGGGRNLEAIEAVCTGDGVEVFDTLDLLQQLVEKSLLSVEEGPEAEQRYTMIESVWQYVREKLDEAGEFDQLRERHLAWFLKQAGMISPALEGPEIARWLEKADAERNNFRLALDWAMKSPATVRAGLRLSAYLTHYWEIRGFFQEGRYYFAQLLAVGGDFEPTKEFADATAGSARMAWLQDQTTEAIALYERAIRLYQTIGDLRAMQLQRAFLAFNLRNAGKEAEASVIFDEVVDYAAAHGDGRLLAIARNGQAASAGDRGDFKECRRLREESLVAFRSAGYKWITGYMLWGLSRACIADRDPVSAREALAEWVEIARELKTRWVFPYMLFLYAGVHHLENNNHVAAQLLGAAVSLRDGMGMQFDAVDHKESEETLQLVRRALEEGEFQRMFDDGKSVPLAEAVNLAQSGQ